MKKRVVITGLGVVAPNGVGIPEFTKAIKKSISGIRFFPELKELNFSCHLGAIPKISEEEKRQYLSELQLRNFNSSGILYGIIAGMDALKDAKIDPAKQDGDPLWDLGIIFGSGTSGVEKFRESIYKIDAGNARRLGSTAVVQTMASGVSAYLVPEILLLQIHRPAPLAPKPFCLATSALPMVMLLICFAAVPAILDLIFGAVLTQ